MACPAARSFRLVLDWDIVLQRYEPDQGAGPVIEPEELPLTPRTVDALRRWHRAYSDLTSRDESAAAADDRVDWRLLEDDGLRLWLIVREELGPSCQVFFYSELFNDTFATPDEYEQVVGDEGRRAGAGRRPSQPPNRWKRTDR